MSRDNEVLPVTAHLLWHSFRSLEEAKHPIADSVHRHVVEGFALGKLLVGTLSTLDLADDESRISLVEGADAGLSKNKLEIVNHYVCVKLMFERFGKEELVLGGRLGKIRVHSK